MNTDETKAFVEKHGVIAIKADKTDKFSRESEEINELLVELGNQGQVIPFLAIYPAGGGKPILIDGVLSQSEVLDALEEAVPSRADAQVAERTAMKPSS